MVFLSTCPVGFEDAVQIHPAKLPGFLELLFGGGRWRRMKWHEMSNSGSDKSWKKGRWTSDAVGSGDGEGLLKEVSSGLGVGGAPPAGESEGADREEGMGHRGMCETPPWSLRDGFLFWCSGKRPEGCSVGSDAEGRWGCRAQKVWLLSVPHPLQPRSVLGSLLVVSFLPQTVPWAGEIDDGNGSGLNVGHPKRPSANPLNL